MYRLIDTHSDLDELNDLDPIIEEAKKVGVFAVVAVGLGQESDMQTLEISQVQRRFFHPAFGLHAWQLAGLGTLRWMTA